MILLTLCWSSLLFCQKHGEKGERTGVADYRLFTLLMPPIAPTISLDSEALSLAVLHAFQPSRCVLHVANRVGFPAGL